MNPTGPASVWTPGSVVPDVAERVFAAPSDLDEIAWDEANIILSDKESKTNPGPFRYSVTPHLRFVRAQIGRTDLRQVTIRKNDQAGVTRIVHNRICRRVAESPTNILYGINSLEEARRMSDRLRHTLERSPATADAVTERPEEDVELQTLTFKLRDLYLYLAGGGSIGAVANKSLGLVAIDEGDKIPRVSSGSNTHIVDEAKSRFKTMPVGEGVLYLWSKPNQETDIVTTEFELGTKHLGFMPCPHCGHVQHWVQERLRFDHCRLPSNDYDKQRVLTETHYLCERAGTPQCPDGRIFDRHRSFTTEHIEYRPTNPNPEPGHVSIQLDDFLLNPVYFPDASLGRIALDLIAGFRNPAKMKAVQAARFGLPEMLQRAQLKEEDVLALRSNYLRGTAPRGLIYVGLYSDLQGYGPKWCKFGFRRNGELVVIDWGTFLAIDDLMEEARRPVPEIDESAPVRPANPLTGSPAEYTPTGQLLHVQHGGIDEGDQQKLVHAFVIRSGFFFLPTKGRGGYQVRGKSLVVPSERDFEGHKFAAYHFSDDQFKKELYLWRIRDHAKIQRGVSRTPRMHLPLDVDDAYVTELMAERLTVKQARNGYPVEEWEVTGPNDYGDATKGALVMWHVIGPEILQGLEAAEAAGRAAPPPDSTPPRP